MYFLKINTGSRASQSKPPHYSSRDPIPSPTISDDPSIGKIVYLFDFSSPLSKTLHSVWKLNF